jgi:CRP-like cAMP-binding protein
MLDLVEALRWQDWAGNGCYLLLATSYLFTNMFWLRVLAIVSLAFEAVYFYFGASPPLWVGIGWNAIFVSINLAMLILLVLSERARRFASTEEAMLKRGLFADLEHQDFNRLLKIGEWREVPRGTVLTRQHHELDHFYALADGLAEVEVDGRMIGILQNGAFIGEMSLLTNEMASATVTTIASCKMFVVEKQALNQLLGKYPEIQRGLAHTIGRDLSRKLRLTSSLPLQIT